MLKYFDMIYSYVLLINSLLKEIVVRRMYENGSREWKSEGIINDESGKLMGKDEVVIEVTCINQQLSL